MTTPRAAVTSWRVVMATWLIESSVKIRKSAKCYIYSSSEHLFGCLCSQYCKLARQLRQPVGSVVSVWCALARRSNQCRHSCCVCLWVCLLGLSLSCVSCVVCLPTPWWQDLPERLRAQHTICLERCVRMRAAGAVARGSLELLSM